MNVHSISGLMPGAMSLSAVVLMAAAIAGCRSQGNASTAGSTDDTAAVPTAPVAHQQPVADATQADAPILDACALISQADADAVLGTPSKLSEHVMDTEFASHCSYASTDTSNGPNNFAVAISTDENAADAKSGHARQKEAHSNAPGLGYDIQMLPGIGDDAFLALNKSPPGTDSGAQQQILELVKGSKEIEIIVSYFGKQRSTDGLKALAKNLADKS